MLKNKVFLVGGGLVVVLVIGCCFIGALASLFGAESVPPIERLPTLTPTLLPANSPTPVESPTSTPVPPTETLQPTQAPEPTTPGDSPDPVGPDRDCPDFSSQAEAQSFYEAAGGPARDPHRLDQNGDGIACEDTQY